MRHIYSWLSFEEMAADLGEEVDRLVAFGVDRQSAITRVAAIVAMNRDRIAHPGVATGLVEMILNTRR